MCQYGADGQNIIRYCNGQTWKEDASMCPTLVTKQFKEISSEIQNVRFQMLIWNTYHFNLQQKTITTENVVNVTARLQTVVSQATEVVDHSVSNLAVVTTVIIQISNISSPNAPVINDVGACILHAYSHVTVYQMNLFFRPSLMWCQC